MVITYADGFVFCSKKVYNVGFFLCAHKRMVFKTFNVADLQSTELSSSEFTLTDLQSTELSSSQLTLTDLQSTGHSSSELTLTDDNPHESTGNTIVQQSYIVYR